MFKIYKSSYSEQQTDINGDQVIDRVGAFIVAVGSSYTAAVTVL